MPDEPGLISSEWVVREVGGTRPPKGDLTLVVLEAAVWQPDGGTARRDDLIPTGQLPPELKEGARVRIYERLNPSTMGLRFERFEVLDS